MIDRLFLLCANLYCYIFHARLIRRYLKKAAGRKIPFHLPMPATPATANEKFLWRKIFDKDPRFVFASDKLLCKEWMSGLYDGLVVTPALWRHDQGLERLIELAENHALVLKANHGCGTNLFIEKGCANISDLNEKIKIWTSKVHGSRDGEWSYSKIAPTVFAEEWIRPDEGQLSELKFMVFSGKILRFLHICGRFEQITTNAWRLNKDREAEKHEEHSTLSDSDFEIPLPANYQKAALIAECIGRDFDHIRVDILTDGKTLWLGELTVYNQAGYLRFPSAYDPVSPISRAWDIRKSHFLRQKQHGFWKKKYANALKKHL